MLEQAEIELRFQLWMKRFDRQAKRIARWDDPDQNVARSCGSAAQASLPSCNP